MLLVIWQFIWAFCSRTWRKLSKIFLLQYKKLDDYEMHVVYYLRWIFTITKWYGKSPCKETIIAPTMLNLNGWKIYHYFLLRRKRTAAICFFVRLCEKSCAIITIKFFNIGNMVSSTLVIQYKWYIGSYGKQRLAVWGIAHGWPKIWEETFFE